MKAFLDFLDKSDKLSLFPVLSTLFSLIVLLGSFFLLYQYLPSHLPLFYSRPWGNQQLAEKDQFLLLPFLSLLLSLLNLLLASQLHSSQIVLKRTLLGSLFVINAVILITALKILFLFF